MSKIIKKLNDLKKVDASSIYIFRIGIFYNIFNEDAKILKKITDIDMNNTTFQQSFNILLDIQNKLKNILGG